MDAIAPSAGRHQPTIIPNPIEDDESFTSEAAPLEVHYYVLRCGKILGPFTIKRVMEMAITHTVGRSDFVQIAGSTQWLPLPIALDPTSAPPDGTNPAPDLGTILRWAWMRLRYNIDEKSLWAGAACLAIALIGVLCTQWPVVFWGPLVVPPVVAAWALLRRKRILAGSVLLVAAASIPWLAPYWV